LIIAPVSGEIDMISKQEFIDWLCKSGNPDDVVLAALIEENVIGMPRGEGTEKKCGGDKCH
jgi:hypothetical protein